ncbi:lyase family protein [Nonomuraea sp. NPDC047897]|uniref:lyase family protein n=1 Tax=Nonomuraea sp. NPDC047897 TaxID=3364346 RepID=UPI0037178DFF
MTSDGTRHGAATPGGASERAARDTAPDAGLLTPVRAGTRVERLTSDTAWARAMLDAEAALARAQARAGLIPERAAALITRAAADLTVDPAGLARRARRSATPVVPLVTDLRAAAGEAAGFVHRGATSQDIVDSAAMLVSSRALAAITAGLEAAMRPLAALADRHRDTVMAARTLGQQAVPTTFGLKAAGWLAGLLRARDRLAALRLPAQLGGAAGTLAALVETAAMEPPSPAAGAPAPQARALALVDLFAEELGLATPQTPWHADRTVVGELGAALTGTAEALGKVATDVILLAQTEVGEVAEAAPGGSSAMPHKRNPALSVLVRSAALQVPVYAWPLGRSGEHERAAGAWQAEWAPLRECLRLTGGAAETAAELLAGLEVFPGRMRANLDLTGGRVVSERLAAHLPADELAELLRGDGPLRGPDDLLDPAAYLGAARELVDRVLAAYRDRRT